MPIFIRVVSRSQRYSIAVASGAEHVLSAMPRSAKAIRLSNAARLISIRPRGAAVVSLTPHSRGPSFAEPCAGDGDIALRARGEWTLCHWCPEK
jgi:hypothetical protein